MNQSNLGLMLSLYELVHLSGVTSLVLSGDQSFRGFLSSGVCFPPFNLFSFQSLHLKEIFPIVTVKCPDKITGPCRSAVSSATWREVREHSRLSISPESRAEEGGCREEKELSANGGGVHYGISVGVVKKELTSLC